MSPEYWLQLASSEYWLQFAQEHWLQIAPYLALFLLTVIPSVYLLHRTGIQRLYTREDRCESGRKKGRTFDRPDMIEREYNRSSTFSRAKLDVLVAEYNWTTPQDGRVVS